MSKPTRNVPAHGEGFCGGGVVVVGSVGKLEGIGGSVATVGGTLAASKLNVFNK